VAQYILEEALTAGLAVEEHKQLNDRGHDDVSPGGGESDVRRRHRELMEQIAAATGGAS
jgi:hypothetical protein